MADFCKQCSKEIFGRDYRELAALITEDEAKQGLMACVLCEGCGPVQVNIDGECQSIDCIKKHGKPEVNGHVGTDDQERV